ncbi:MAG: hypothetical protein ACE5RT_04330 [Nitrosopumilaceae archaeon]
MAEVDYMAQVLKKTDIISIRMDSNLSSKLHEKSDEQKVSLNTLINNMLEKQVHWYDLTNEVGWVNIFRSTFKELMDSISKEKAIKIGQTVGKEDLQNSINFFYGKVDLNTILDLLKRKFQTMKVQFRQISKNGTEKIIIQHDLGKNWPHLVVAELNELLNELGYRIISDEYNKRGFSFEIISVRDD